MSIKDKISLFLFKLKRKWKLFARRFTTNKVYAVHDDDLEAVLENIGILEQIKAGEMCCKSCGCRVTMENLGVIENQNDAIKVFCMATSCSINKGENG